jgi:hypothetical protein
VQVISQMRMQRYGVFLIWPNFFEFFFKKVMKVDE